MFKLTLLFIATSVFAQLQFDECKRDCTLDWVDCVHGCDSIGNPQYCHTNCQKIVHGCLDECPRIVCIDRCRVILDECRNDLSNPTVACEHSFNSCEKQCEEVYQPDI